MRKNGLLLLCVCWLLVLGLTGCSGAAEDVEAEQEMTQPLQVTQPVQEAPETPNVTDAPEEVFYVPRMDERARTNTISAEMKEKAKQMEAASYQKLPKWYGTSPNSKCECGWVSEGLTSQFTKLTVEEMAAEGFNFIRVPLDTRSFYLEEITPDAVGPHFRGNSENVNLKELQNLDDLIAWCIEYDIHVCLDVHNTPGGYMIGGDEEATRELLFTEESAEEQMFFDFWDMTAARYADISTNALSFNLYNEPPHFLGEEQYVRFVKRGIEVIHGYTPERLIFVDMLEYAHEPVEGLVGEPVVQTFHFYDPSSFTHANFDVMTGPNHDNPIVVSYPVPPISCALRDEDSYTIHGEFPEGSELYMFLGMGNVGGVLSVLADGEVMYTQEITEQLVNQAGLEVTYDDYGTGVFNCYEAGAAEMRLTCPVTKDAQEIEFRYWHENPVLIWLELNNLVVETPTYRTGLSAMWIEGVELPVTDAVIDANGIVTLTQDLSQYEEGYQLIEKLLGKYHEFSERTGVQVMLQEFGAMCTNDIQCTAKYFDDVMSVCDKYGFSWSMWNYDGGDFSYVKLHEMFRRSGATYEEVSEGRYIPLELREVFQKHMAK